jgi:hypothetical protein
MVMWPNELRFSCRQLSSGVGGIHPDAGLIEYNLEDAQVEINDSCADSHRLADGHKFGKTCFSLHHCQY